MPASSHRSWKRITAPPRDSTIRLSISLTGSGTSTGSAADTPRDAIALPILQTRVGARICLASLGCRTVTAPAARLEPEFCAFGQYIDPISAHIPLSLFNDNLKRNLDCAFSPLHRHSGLLDIPSLDAVKRLIDCFPGVHLRRLETARGADEALFVAVDSHKSRRRMAHRNVHS